MPSMQDIADKCTPKSAVSCSPKGWLEPANVRRSVPVGAAFRLFAFAKAENDCLFQKTHEGDYDMLDAKGTEDSILEVLGSAGGSVVVDDGVLCMTLCKPDRDGPMYLVDPHDTRTARVREVTRQDISTIVDKGVMCIAVFRA